MKKLFFKTFHCFLLSFVLYWTQCMTVYAEANNANPPATSSTGVSNETDKDHNDKTADNDRYLEQNKENDEAIEAEGTTTQCRGVNDAAEQQYNDMVAFEQVYQQQNFDAIDNALSASDQTSRDLANAQGGVDGGAGEDHMARQRAEQLAEDRQEALDRWKAAEERRIELKDPPDGTFSFGRNGNQSGIIPSLRSRVNSIEADCSDIGGCSQARRDELARLRGVLAERNSEYRIVRAEEIAQKRELDRLDREIRSNEGNIRNAGAAVEGARDDQRAVNQISGCGGNEATGNCDLGGTAFNNYERIGALVNATTESAARLARIQTEKANEAALMAENNSDYRLFELALDDFDPNHTAEYLTSAGFSGHRMAMSNLELMAYAGAATKNLRCVPEVTGEGNDGADSRAYHIFRAASATILMAQINDTSLYTDTSQCRAYEDFTDDDRDTQFRTVQRAANLHTEIFENLCLRINPQDPALKERCDDYLKEVLGEDYIDKPRTREAALVMLNDAKDVALQEVEVKNQKISDAHANVMKGEAWIDKDESIINTMIGLVAITLTLTMILNGVSAACCAAIFCACPVTVAAWLNMKALYGVYYGILIWYGIDLRRARSFTAEWRRKLALAKKYTHLECNYAAARGEKDSLDSFVERRAQEAREAVDKAKKDVLDQIYGKDEQQPTPTTGMFDQTINNAIKKQLANAHDDNHALLLSYEWTRHQKGALSSLPYDAIQPKVDEVEHKLGLFGASLQRKSLNLVTNVTSELIPTAHANDGQGTFNADLTPSLGMVSGSSSFSYFLAKRNKAWQDFAFDAGTLDGQRIDMDALFVQTSNLRPEENTGFPVPETRVTTIQNMINLLEDNLNQLDMGIAEAAAQMDAYIVLLNEMRQRMNLGDQGLDDAEVDNIDFTKGKCLRTNGGGSLEIDEDCDCKLTGTCSVFSYPEFAAFVPNANTANGAIGEDYVKDVAQGNAMPTSVSKSDADSKAIKLSKAIEEREKEINKQAKANNVPPRDINQEANDYLDASRKGANQQYRSQSPELASYESRSGKFRIPGATQLATTGNAKDAVKVDKVKDPNAAKLAAAKQAGNKSFKERMAALKAKLAAQKKALDDQDVMANLQELEDGDIPTFDAAQLAGINDQVQEDDGNNNRYRHQRRPASAGSSIGDGDAYFIDNDGISGRNTDLFKVISKRYHKTAFPIFDIE